MEAETLLRSIRQRADHEAMRVSLGAVIIVPLFVLGAVILAPLVVLGAVSLAPLVVLGAVSLAPLVVLGAVCAPLLVFGVVILTPLVVLGVVSRAPLVVCSVVTGQGGNGGALQGPGTRRAGPCKILSRLWKRLQTRICDRGEFARRRTQLIVTLSVVRL